MKISLISPIILSGVLLFLISANVSAKMSRAEAQHPASATSCNQTHQCSKSAVQQPRMNKLQMSE